MNNYFNAYRATVIKAGSVSLEVQRVSADAVKNACDTLRRDINHKADDASLLAMQGDAEWLAMWGGSVSAILSSGEYPSAESFFAEFGIAA